MRTLLKNLPPIQPVDKVELIRALDAWAAQAGIVLDPDATPEQAQQMMRDAGIRPEDNILTSELLRMRYPEDYPDKDDAK